MVSVPHREQIPTSRSIGRRVSLRYDILSAIGSGGTSTVFRAIDTTLRRIVALKLLHPSLAGEEVRIRELLHEARILAAVDSPYIVPVYDAGDDPQCGPYLIMKMVEAPTLKRLLQEGGPLSVRRALRIGADIASALHELHRSALIHRDVKPGNIMVAGGDRAMLIDLGLAGRSRDDHVRPGVISGTPPYMAPEQAFAPETVDARTDLYALGAVLFEAIAGRPPFQGSTATEIFTRHAYAPIPRVTSTVEDVPPAVERLIRRALGKGPHERFSSALELRRALESAMSGGLDARI